MEEEPFRDFLNGLGEEDLKAIHKEVSTKFEPNAYVRKSLDVDGPAFLFDNIANHPGWRIAAGTLASRRRVARAMGCSMMDVAPTFAHAVRNRIAPRIVSEGQCKQVVWEGEEGVNLNKIPIVWHSEKDAGPFITAGVVIAKDLDTRATTLGIHRMQLKGRDKLGIAITGQRRLLRYFDKAEKLNRPLEIAVAVGPDPRVTLASQAKVPDAVDKFAVAGGLKGRPVNLVKCETVDLEVPAESELVLEGEILPGVREPEGPFAEFTGTYAGGVRNLPAVRIKAVTMRRDPIYVPALAGVPPDEDFLIGWPAQSAVAFDLALAGCATVKAVNLVGTFYFVAVSMTKRNEGEPYNVMSAVLGGDVFAKFCLVVDEDIDVFSVNDVMWALQTRVQPHKDTHVFPIMAGVPLDPSAPSNWRSSKIGIDATIPLDQPRDRYERVVVPGVEKVSW